MQVLFAFRKSHVQAVSADKVSDVVMKAPLLENVLRQPFSTTGLLSGLMMKCADKVRELQSVSDGMETLLKNRPQYQGLLLIKYDTARILSDVGFKISVLLPNRNRMH